ncbi:hypothetical protein HPP92_017822 [Vanilla planifolia]|uniref:Uncharacterized protein n=1 Tax=Vanilla planifolia TaxID=51239 RepID=A0A835QF68_VANPL|nr:hypothetical protein HPP92_017822 [Vanilla planifolia]
MVTAVSVLRATEGVKGTVFFNQEGDGSSVMVKANMWKMMGIEYAVGEGACSPLVGLPNEFE